MDEQTRITRRSFATAAMAGLVAGAGLIAAGCKSNNNNSATQPGTQADTGSTSNAMLAKHDCKGKNDCKGQGGCNTGDNGCKGKNSCKGKGGCST